MITSNGRLACFGTPQRHPFTLVVTDQPAYCCLAPAAPAESALTGRTDTFKRVVFDDVPVPASYRFHPSTPSGSSSSSSSSEALLVRLQPGDYVAVEVTAAGGTLHARPLARTTLREFVAAHGSAAPLDAVGGAAAAAAAAAAAVGE